MSTNKRPMFVFTLLTLPLLAFALSPNGSYTINIGLSLPYDLAIYTATAGHLAALELRVRQWHQQTSIIHPNASINLIFRNTDASSTLTVIDGFELVTQDKVIALIGAAFSSLTTLTSIVIQPFKIPQCDGSATSPVLSNKKNYPNFFRAISNDNLQAYAILQYCKHNLWTEVVIVYTNDGTYGSGLLQAFQQYALNDGTVSIKSTLAITPGATDLTDVVSLMSATKSNVYLLFTLNEAYTLLTAIKGSGMWKTGKAFVYSDGGETMIGTPDMLEGAISIVALEGIGSLHDQFASYYLQNYNSTAYWNWTGTTPTVPLYGYFFINCLDSFIKGFDALLNSNANYTIDDLVSGKLNKHMTVPGSFSFPNDDTVTGKVILDSNGDRQGFYQVLNYHSGNWNPVYNYKEDGFEYIADTYWPGQSLVTPSTVINYSQFAADVSFNSGVGAYLGAIGIIGLIVTISLNVATYLRRTQKVIMKTSPKTSMFMSVGIFLSFIQLLLMVQTPNNASCAVDIFLLPLAFNLFYGTLAAKTQRILRIFNGTRFSTQFYFSDVYVLMVGVLTTIPAIFISIIWAAVDVPVPKLVNSNMDNVYWTCSSKNVATQQNFVYTLLVYEIIVLISVVYFAIQARNVPSDFKQSLFITISTFNTVFVSVIVVPLMYVTVLPVTVTNAIKGTGIMYVSFINLMSFLGFNVFKTLKHETMGASGKMGTHTSDHISRIGMETNATIGAKDWSHFSKVMVAHQGYFTSTLQTKFLAINDRLLALFNVEAMSVESKVYNVSAKGEFYYFKALKDFSVGNVGNVEGRFTIPVHICKDELILEFEDQNELQYWQKAFEGIAASVRNKAFSVTNK